MCVGHVLRAEGHAAAEGVVGCGCRGGGVFSREESGQVSEVEGVPGADVFLGVQV